MVLLIMIILGKEEISVIVVALVPPMVVVSIMTVGMASEFGNEVTNFGSSKTLCQIWQIKQ